MFESITDYQMSRGEVCILLADFESPKMWHKMSFYQNYWNISPFVDHHCKKKEKYFHIKHKYFFFYPPPERVERPLELGLLELVFPVEDPDLLQRHGHGAQQQPVLAAREPQPWAGEFWIWSDVSTETYHTVNRLRSFLSSGHQFIRSLGH